MKTLALVMIVKNEERCLARCLEAAKGLVDKIYITDTGSADRTREIAESFGAVVSDYVWKQDFADARNYSLEQSDCDWNLVLDADEYLISGTREDIRKFLENPQQIGCIERKDYYVESIVDGKEQVVYNYTQAARLLPRGVRYTGRIHEQENSNFPIRAVPLLFDHDGYMQGGKSQRNLEILLEEVVEKPKDPYVLFQTAKTLHGVGRSEEACEYYDKFYKYAPLTGTGYRTTGIIGWLECLITVKDYDKALWLVEQEKERMADNADFHFARGELYMKAILADTAKYVGYLPLLEQSYLRCLEIGEVPMNQGVSGCGSFRAAHNLGAWYEVSGNMEKAITCYQMAAAEDYLPSIQRLKELQG